MRNCPETILQNFIKTSSALKNFSRLRTSRSLFLVENLCEVLIDSTAFALHLGQCRASFFAEQNPLA